MRIVEKGEKMEIPKYFYFRVRVINKGTGIEVEDAHDVDLVEVVRCKDCKYYYAWDAPLVGGFCFHDGTPMLNVEPMHYCAWGERREDETD